MNLRPLRFKGCWLAAFGLCTAVVGGCGEPLQVSPGNRQLIESLMTAVSAKRMDWLDQNQAALDKRHQLGGTTAAEHETFQAIIAVARAERWSEAQKQLARLAKAQRLGPGETRPHHH